MIKQSHFTLLLFSFLICFNTYSQLDKEFWFVSPAVTKDHSAENTCACNPPNNKCGAAPASFNFTNVNNTDAQVIIEQPANIYHPVTNPTGFQPIAITVPANDFLRYELWGNDLCNADNWNMRKLVENRLDPVDPTTILEKGIHITSTEMVTVYYEVEEQNNSDIYVLKGANALGDEFYTNFQTNADNHNINPQKAYSSIDIVAVDDATVWVYPTEEIIGWGAAPFSVELEQGESISLVPGRDLGGGNYQYYRDRRLQGTRIYVEDGKKIAVTISDDSVDGDSGCYDLIGDQIIPVEAIYEGGQREPLIGTEYIVLRGDLSAADNDRIYILATENGTNITVYDITNPPDFDNYSINEGDQVMYTIPNNSDITLVESDNPAKPIYVMHVTGAGDGCEIGGSVLPTTSACTGSFNVGFSRGTDTNKDFLLNIMVREENPNDSARYCFVFNGDSITFIGDNFTEIPGTKWWAGQFDFDSIGQHSRNILSNTKNIFHLGTLNGGSGNGGNYGYFSNYGTIEARSYISGIGQPGAKLCWGQTVQLVADGGLYYTWFPSTYLSDSTVQFPYCTPFSNIKYNVIVSGASCETPDTAKIDVFVGDSLTADFTLTNFFGCSPLEVGFVNKSYNNNLNYWFIDDTFYTFDPVPDPIYLYNNTDTAQDVEIMLITIDLSGICTKKMERVVRVYPEISASFFTDTTIGCTPLTISFDDNSSGNIDTVSGTGYEWDFGDLGTSSDRNPVHTFQNITTSSAVYNVELVTTSPFLCRDTARSQITVHPYIEAGFVADSTVSCSPLEIVLDNTSLGGDDFFWSFYDRTRTILDSTYNTSSENPMDFIYNDTSQTAPDTIYIDMIARNDEGCYDTATTKRLIIYPEVHSLFDADDDDICDSVSVLFSNNSIGYDLLYEWNFGDGNSRFDTTKNPFSHVFYNRGEDDTLYRVRLTATSEYLCRDTLSRFITVHPFIKANFGLEFASNCSPLDAEMPNLSQGGDRFDWDFGDGDFATVFAPDTMHHQYENISNNDTIFNIKLLASNNEGCEDSMMRSVLLYPRVVAAYNFATDSTGCNPLIVDFTNNSQGKNLSYLWEFGDGSNSNDFSPVNKVFSNNTSHDTTYYVQLTATNPDGCDSSITKPVEVYSKVQAGFTISKIDSCSPFRIRVKNNCSGGISDFIWKYTEDDSIVLNDFSDPDIPTYVNQTSGPQIFEINLRTLNSHGCEDEYIDTVTIYPETHADFSPDNLSGCQPLNVSVTNNTNIKPNTSFYWDFGDGTFSYAENPAIHNYVNQQSTSQFFDIKLEATSQYDCFDDTTIQIEVYPYIIATFTVDKPFICSDEFFVIDRSDSEGGIDEYWWDFDNDGTDDSNISIESFNYTYSNTGTSSLTETIRLTVSNAQDCEDSYTESIDVHPRVVANFSVDNLEPCHPHITQFTNLSNNIGVVSTDFYWDFGDGSNSSLTNPRHQFKNFSDTTDLQSTITLTATSDYGCDSTVTQIITIHPKPKSEFEFEGTSVGCPPFTPAINNLSKGTNLSYSWTLENGSVETSTDFEPVSTFDNFGNDIISNDITLITTTDYNCSDTSQLIIQVYPGVRVGISASPQLEGCNPLTIDFDGSHLDNASYFEWDFGDDTKSTLEDPQHMFSNEGIDNKEFNVTFKAISYLGCEDDSSVTVTVYPSPLPEFVPSPVLQQYDTINDNTTVQFINLTMHQDNWDYEWDFGDGNTGENSEYTFTHVYGYNYWGDPSINFAIPVSLYATNRDNPECNRDVSHNVYIIPPRPQINIGEDLAGCVPFEVSFNASVKYTDDTYDWDFGFDNETSSEDEPVFVYTEPGIYMARLIVTGPGGTNVDFKDITVYSLPEVDFTFAPSEVLKESQTEPSEEIKFYNNSKLGEEYEWYYRYQTEDQRIENPFSVEKEPIITLNDTGRYYITLVVETEEGCIDSLIHPTPIYVKGVKEFEMPDYFYLNPDAISSGTYDKDIPVDGLFFPKSQGVEKYQLEIYNRWGEIIFRTTNINEGWNGCIENNPSRPVKQDVYVWKVKATFTNGQTKIYAGDVTVIITPERKTPDE
jgi:PKD repeat protein